jgi:signal transduction histidine kinase
LSKTRYPGEARIVRVKSEFAGNEAFVRPAFLLIILFEISCTAVGGFTSPKLGSAAVPLQLFNLLAGFVCLSITWVAWFDYHWRPTLSGLFAAIITTSTVVSLCTGSTEPLFISIVLLLVGSGSLVPWNLLWQGVLTALCLSWFAINAIWLSPPEQTTFYRWLGLLAAAGLAHIARASMLELVDARENALAASRAKTEFLATMSHEIRTPMNAILGMADLVAESPLNAEQRGYVQVIVRNGTALLQLINDIIDLAKVESGRLELEDAEFDLRELIEHVVDTFSSRACEKGLDLAVDIKPDVPKRLVGDALRLRQVLVNLVGNAVKFTDSGSVLLSVENESIDGQLRFSLRDTGRGVAPDKLEAIFESFTQADSSTTRRYGGSGLGLAIAKRMVKLMGGKIWAESKVGHGSTFYFDAHFGVAKAPPSDAQRVGNTKASGVRSIAAEERSQVRSEPSATSSGRPVHILLAEDSPDNRELIKAYLKGLPYTIEVAENGQVALEKFMHARRFDLVLMDVHMPVMDGYTAVRKIRAWERANDCAPAPIVALTASVFDHDVREAMDAGCTAHLGKPVKKSALLATIHDLTGESPSKALNGGHDPAAILTDPS